MAISDQPVTARGIGYREILIPVIDDCLNLPDQSASLLLGPPSWSKLTIDKKTFPTRFVQLPVRLINTSQFLVPDEMPNSTQTGQPTATKKSAVSVTVEVHQVFLTGSSEIQ